jgi:hypothetical protein
MLHALAIPAAVEVLEKGCFYRCGALQSFRLEAHSQLNRIESSVFAGCSSLKAICIPPGVEVICEGCYVIDGTNPVPWKAKGNLRLIVQNF